MLEKEFENMSLAEKRHREKAGEVLKAHPDYVTIALRRAFCGVRMVSNLAKDLAWLRGIEQALDMVVLNAMVQRGYVSQLEARRYEITTAGMKLIGHPLGKEIANG